jgi:dUTP pyrophosphatase
MLPVQLKQLRPEAIMPEYKTLMAAGLDLAAAISSTIILEPGAPATLIPTGIAVYIGDANYAYYLFPRSGKGHKEGVVLGNGTGVIDADYQGEVMVSIYIHPGYPPVAISPGDRIAQMVFMPVERVEFSIVSDFHETSIRGAGGFGSTGAS